MRKALLAPLLALALAGCGSEESDPGPPPPPAAGAPGPGGGLTIAEALETEAEGTLLVRGSLLADRGGARLCSALAESFPPQCGQPSLRVEGLDLAELEAPLSDAQGVTWSEREVALLGDVEGDVLRVSATSR